MARAMIYKPRESLWRNLKAGFRDHWADGGEENLYRLNLHSLFVPDVAVFGRWKKNYHLGRELGYEFDPNFFRFSQDSAELQRVQKLIESGEGLVVKDFSMPDELVEETVEHFRAYEEKIRARETAVNNWKTGRQDLQTGARYIANSCFGRVDLDIK